MGRVIHMRQTHVPKRRPWWSKKWMVAYNRKQKLVRRTTAWYRKDAQRYRGWEKWIAQQKKLVKQAKLEMRSAHDVEVSKLKAKQKRQVDALNREYAKAMAKAEAIKAKIDAVKRQAS